MLGKLSRQVEKVYTRVALDISHREKIDFISLMGNNHLYMNPKVVSFKLSFQKVKVFRFLQ